MERIEFDVLEGWNVAQRYAFLERVARLTRRRGVRFCGFDVSRHVRLLLDGPERSIDIAVRAIKSGTCQVAAIRGRPLLLGTTRREEVLHPVEALAELHRDAVEPGTDPLNTPWSSHRDLLGYRQATFFDADYWHEKLDPTAFHRRCGGGQLPTRVNLKKRPDLDLTLRVASAVLGRAPGDRRAFGLFCQLARLNGVQQIDVARAVLLSPRRIRQLQQGELPQLRTAALALSDRRLRQVP